MSRVGKQKLKIPEHVTVTLIDGVCTVVGPHGSLTQTFKDAITITIENSEVSLAPASELDWALWGTYASHIENMIMGVVTPFEKKLILEGVGYKSDVSGNKLNLALGFSHPVVVTIPEGLTVTAEKNVITVKGINKELVGRFSASVRNMKKPEPYKGKGFRYDGEVIRRKQGKKTA